MSTACSRPACARDDWADCSPRSGGHPHQVRCSQASPPSVGHRSTRRTEPNPVTRRGWRPRDRFVASGQVALRRVGQVGGAVRGWILHGSEPPIPIKVRPVSGSPAGPAPSHIRLTDCADRGGLEAPPWDYCRRRRRRRDLLVASSPTGGQGVAGSNPVVPTARARPGELVLVQLTGPFSCPDITSTMIYTASRLGPIWDPRRCSDRRLSVRVQVPLCRGE
jgi:hypothetical protein